MRRRAVFAPVVVATAGPDAVAGVTKASPPTQSAPVRSRAGAARVHRVQRWTVAVAAAGLGFGLTACGSAAKPAPVAVGSTTTASTSSTTALPATTAPPVLGTSAMAGLVTAFYNQYVDCVGTPEPTTCTRSVVKEYGTPTLLSHYTPAADYEWQIDPVVCAQNTPTGLHVSAVTSTADSATGTVTETFSGSTVTPRFEIVEDRGTPKINSITCNPPVSPSKLLGSGGVSPGSAASLNGTYTITVPAGDEGCGTPPLSGDILTLSGASASIRPVGASTVWTGTSSSTGTTVSIKVNNGIVDAPGAIAINLSGSPSASGDLSGESVNQGIYPGGSQGFSCTAPFTATRTATPRTEPVSPSTTTAPTGAPLPCTRAALTAAAKAVDGSNVDGLDTSAQGFGCAGKFAYAGVIVGSGSTKNEVTILFMAVNGTWQAANRAIYCPSGAVPAQIYQLACATN